MNDSFGGGFTQTNREEKQESKSEGALPIFIRQLHKQKEDVVKVWGLDYKMIKIVGVVRNIDHSATKITYTIQDITSRINAYLWVDEGDAPSESSIMINTYVRVYGALRHQNDSKYIMIFKIQPVNGINEIATHYLEVANARYQAEEYYRSGETKMEVDGNNFNAPVTASQISTQGGPTSAKHQAVVAAIRQITPEQEDTGINKRDLYRKFPHLTEAEVNRIIEDLVNDGHIYSTIDSDHYLSCV